MIRSYIENIEDVALKVVLIALEEENKRQRDEINELKTEIKDIKDNVDTFNDTKKVVEAYTNLTKVVKKTAVGAIVTGIIGFILFQLGIVGG